MGELFLPYVPNKAFRGYKVLIKLDEVEAFGTKVRRLVSQLLTMTHGDVFDHKCEPKMGTHTHTQKNRVDTFSVLRRAHHPFPVLHLTCCGGSRVCMKSLAA